MDSNKNVEFLSNDELVNDIQSFMKGKDINELNRISSLITEIYSRLNKDGFSKIEHDLNTIIKTCNNLDQKYSRKRKRIDSLDTYDEFYDN